MNRRKSIKTLIASTGAVLFLSQCGKPQEEYKLENIKDCGDLTGLSEEEIAKRKSLGYEEKSPLEGDKCDNCQLYLPPTKKRKCGGCQLFKGPVNADAYCTYWAPRVENA
ncbi:high-potential iron-sulfur protein [Cyclobacterium sp. 1_MG-2023]|uniref:high-potential iron-sulfur protein n=1 Tax=Cyclobacterium sp. 1_MG-2023 TaxID=3062681 RepID=UPI0026E2AEDF|nr:high-potential iron-sulfur protein [Cyclobacterium sp. 1_MG-2023]MDO6437277.1 high-potential iron-sulfur protein [Cyclobacterium sp. 1_MG-2023]